MYAKRIILALLIVLLTVSSIAAQQSPTDTTCPPFVGDTLTALDSLCAATARNQACYGNVSIDATPREGVSLQFADLGDIVAVSDIESMKLAALDLLGEAWGVALLKIQANLPGTLPGQNVTFLIFGDVEIVNQSDTDVTLPMTATGDVNVRLRPTTNQNNIVTSLKRGTEVQANGILADKSWIRVAVENINNTTTGWVSAQFLATSGTLDSLPTVTGNDTAYGPMQAFFFKTGIGKPECDTAPDDGIVVQTPKGAGRVELKANGVKVTMGSTGYLNAENGQMNLFMLEGVGTMEFNGVRQFIPAGTVGSVPLGEDGFANGAPLFPKPYDPQDVQNLPINSLPEDIEISPPQLPEAIEEVIKKAEEIVETVESGAPVGVDELVVGLWTFTQTITESACNPLEVGRSSNFSLYLTRNGDAYAFDGIPLTRTGPGAYVFNTSGDGLSSTVSVLFSAPTALSGTISSDRGGCAVNSSLVGSYFGPG